MGMNGDGLKVVALISRRKGVCVEKMVSLGRNATIVSRLSPRNVHYRRKLFALAGNQQSRFVRHDIQVGFEKLRESLLFECGPLTSWQFGSDGFTVLTPWLEGQCLSENRRVCETENDTASFRLDAPQTLRDRLRLWVRFFERLAQWHAAGVVHGNLKPGNLLVCDALPLEITDRMPSEFFERKDNVPHVALLDGAVGHLLQAQKGNTSISHTTAESAAEGSLSTAHGPLGSVWHDAFWLPPEASGLADGCYLESSDVFGLAATMAWDLGFMSPFPTLKESFSRFSGSSDSSLEGEAQHARNVFEHLWPVFVNTEQRVFFHSGAWLQWSNRNPVVETLRKLRTLLARVLHPSREKRGKSAREVAFELMVMVTRLAEAAKEERLDPQVTPLTKASPAEWHDFGTQMARLVTKSLDTTDTLPAFLESPVGTARRLWFVAKNKDTNTQSTLRRVTATLSTLEGRALYLRVRHVDKDFPFASLNRFVASILGETLRYNPEALCNPHALFKGLSGKMRLLAQVLPALRAYFGDAWRGEDRKSELGVHARHEALHAAALKLVSRLLETSRLRSVVIDDLHRADVSSLEVFLAVVRDKSLSLRFVLGVREYERPQVGSFRAAHQDLMDSLRARDLGVEVLLGPRVNALAGHIASLSPERARLLAAWTSLPAPFDFDDIEFIGAHANSIPSLVGVDFHDGKRSFPNAIGRDIGIAHAKSPPAGQARDANALLSMDTLRCARELGLLSEQRDAATGRVCGFVWASDRVSLTFSLLLTAKTRRELSFLLTSRHYGDVVAQNAWDTVLRMADLFADSDLTQTAHAAFAAYLRASEALPDIPSARLLATRFARLQERLERQKTVDSDSLVPRIRETLADLSKALGEFEVATRFYEAVGWNTFNPKRKAILRLKSFFPSSLPSREAREGRFKDIVSFAVEAQLLPPAEKFDELDPNLLALHEMRKLEGLMEKESTLDGRGAGGRVSVPLKNLIAVSLKPIDSRAERLPYMPRSKSIREVTYAGFLRAGLGWINSRLVYPEAVRALALAIRAEDGESIVSSLFTLHLSGGRHLRNDVRALLLELATDVATRLGDETEIAEAMCLRAFQAFFYDGNLAECRRCLDMLGATRKDLPSSIRQCASRLVFLCDLENEALETSKLPALRTAELFRRLKDTGLGSWELGHALVDARPMNGGFEKALGGAPDSGLVADLLIEMMEQIIFYGMLSIEHGNAGASHAVCERARAAGLREWLSEGIGTLTLVPDAVAKHWSAHESQRGKRTNGLDPVLSGEFAEIEKSFVHSRRGDFVRTPRSEGGWRAFLSSLAARTLTSDLNELQKEDVVPPHERPEPFLHLESDVWAHQWAHDIAMDVGLRYERASSPDPQRLVALARAAAQAGYLWLSHRVASRAGVDLVNIVRELGLEAQGHLPPSVLHNRVAPATRVNMPTQPTLDVSGTIALNYVLEFLHNMQRSVLEDQRFLPAQVVEIAQCLLKSVPMHTDATEAQVAEALKTAARRLGAIGPATAERDGEERNTSKPDSMRLAG
ncbi:MAG: hypothetical protein IOD12_14295 [Silvanigrellales bacterium]|nr:hypothetical protein [Silvanigrellales bacterium]